MIESRHVEMIFGFRFPKLSGHFLFMPVEPEMTPPTNHSKIAVIMPVAPKVLLTISFISTSSVLKLGEA